jgi:hypothetical protein
MIERLKDAAGRETARAVATLRRGGPSAWTGPVMRVLGGLAAQRARTPAAHAHPAATVLGSALGFTLLGAAAMYLLDPDRGAERREAMRTWLIQQWEAGCGWVDSAMEEMRPARLDGHAGTGGRTPSPRTTEDAPIAK